MLRFLNAHDYTDFVFFLSFSLSISRLKWLMNGFESRIEWKLQYHVNRWMHFELLLSMKCDYVDV